MSRGSQLGTNKWLLTTWPKSPSCFSIIVSGGISRLSTDGYDSLQNPLIFFKYIDIAMDGDIAVGGDKRQEVELGAWLDHQSLSPPS
jgi:hypothetical protein